jgi:GYF domain 2
MAEQWYFGWDDKRFGPFSAAQLKELAALGKLQPRDTVWKEGIEKGMLADKVKNLFPAPEAMALFADARVPVADERLSQSAWNSGPLPPSTNDHAAPDGQSSEIIPDGLMLKVIPEDAAFPVLPAAIDSPRSQHIEEQELNTSSALARSAVCPKCRSMGEIVTRPIAS